MPVAAPEPRLLRRLEMAEALRERGSPEEGLEILEDARHDAPESVQLLYAIGQMAEAAGRTGTAVTAYRDCLRLDPDDRLGAVLRLGLLGETAPPSRAPATFVAALFDQYAPRFDESLVTSLAYRTPEALMHLLTDHAPERRFARAADLGCGTGLMGRLLRGRCAELVGVDLSGGMLAQARQKGIYDELRQEDIVAFLGRHPAAFDLVTMADVLVYLGDLEPLFAALAKGLLPDGIALLSVERHAGPGYVLQPSQRYAHSLSYLETAAATHGLRLSARAQAVLRQDRGEPVMGWLGLLERA